MSFIATTFEAIARQHVDIAHSDTEKHFIKYSADAILGGFGSQTLKYPVLALEPDSGNFQGRLNDNFFQNASIAFCVLKKGKQDSHVYNAQIMEECLQIGKEILCLLDSKAGTELPLSGFYIDNFKYQAIENLFEGCYGYRFEGEWQIPANTQYNPDKWNFNL